MKQLFAGTLTACIALMLVAAPAGHASTPSRIDVSICPNITTTSYPGITDVIAGCGGPVFSPGSVNIPPDRSSCTPETNTDLGTFLTTQNPLGAKVNAGGPNSCATHPPTMGPGAESAAVTLSVVQKGFCPTALMVQARTSPQGGVVFPIGSLPIGSYNVTATLPEQTAGSQSWLQSQATGTLHVGGPFREVTTSALARAGNTFAALLSNSFAGPGAGEFVLTKTRGVGSLSGTEYYGCGTITISGAITFGRHGRLTGEGNLTGGSGNYQDIKGNFVLRGSYSPKTKRAGFVLTGTVTY